MSKKLFAKQTVSKEVLDPSKKNKNKDYVSALKSTTLLLSFRYGNFLDYVSVPFPCSLNPTECRVALPCGL